MMRSNFFKYVFIVFVVVIMVFAIYKIRTDEEAKAQMQQTQAIESEQSKVREINLGIAEYDTMNPITSTNKNVQDIQKLIYEPLVDLTTEYKAEPCLASEWAKQTDTSYIIKLREGVKWSNGKEFTAKDVRFTIDRLKDTQSIYSYNVSEIIQVEVVDDYTLKITLEKEVPFFEYNLIFPIVAEEGYSNESIPLGTGKYKIIQETAENIVLEKNQEWWGTEKTKLSLEKITINKFASLGEMYNSFKIGNVDVISTDNNNLQEYIGKIGYNEKKIQGREHTFLVLNTQNNFLSSTKVRKAISYSLDRDNIVSSVFTNSYYKSDFPLGYGSWLYQLQDTSQDYNPEQAKQELSDEEWTYLNRNWQRNITTTASTNNRYNRYSRYRTRRSTQILQFNLLVKASDANKVAVAENIKEQLANQGIIINIVQAGDSQYSSSLDSKSYDIALCSIYTSANPSMETFFGSNNLANYTNDEVTELIKEVKNTTDETVLKEDYKKIAEIYKSEVPYISLYSNNYSVVYSASLIGDFSPNWFSSFYNVETWAK